MIIPFFLPFAGCPSRCVFCNSRALNQRDDRKIDKKAFDAYIRHHLKRASEGQKTQIAFYGGCFSLIEEALQKKLLDWANDWIRMELVNTIRFSTLPVAVSDDMISYYRQTGVGVIEMGVEIFDNEILAANNRHLDTDQMSAAFERFHQAGFLLGIHLMTGLPRADWDREQASLNLCMRLPFDFARIHPTLVLKDTSLEKMYTRKMYSPLSLRVAVNRSAFFAGKIRTGTGKAIAQTGLFVDSSATAIIIAGPYHPAFGDLVRIRTLIDKVRDALNGEGSIILQQNEAQSFFSHRGFFSDEISEWQFRPIERNQIEVKKA